MCSILHLLLLIWRNHMASYVPPTQIHKVAGNFISGVVDRIQRRLKENKSSVKTYASCDRAFDKAERLAHDFSAYNDTDFDPIFIVVQLSNGRWTSVFMLSEYFNRLENGTDITYFARKGIYCV